MPTALDYSAGQLRLRGLELKPDELTRLAAQLAPRGYRRRGEGDLLLVQAEAAPMNAHRNSWTWRARWAAIAPRERALAGGAIALVALALLWWIALAPALEHLARRPRPSTPSSMPSCSR